ncbi:hypothetical protein GE061_006526 [Apolygus lucorum]|uniref:Uncharacterized protein n=1 Tax=Apolygus lucorum TaxID=248454 RepID=A0A6A4IZJ1_APOLU|nr:hypothetical protein GE061_006526 [Apolygus lucorum]
MYMELTVLFLDKCLAHRHPKEGSSGVDRRREIGTEGDVDLAIGSTGAMIEDTHRDAILEIDTGGRGRALGLDLPTTGNTK